MQLNPYKQEAYQLIRIALPIFTAQLALTSLGVVDTIMSGWVGVNDLAAIGLGTSILLPVFIFATGILLAMTPITARYLGQKKPEKIAYSLTQGVWLAIPIGLISMLVLMVPQPLLNLLQLSPQVYQLTVDYLFYAALGLPGVALYQVYRFFWEGLGITLPTLALSLGALFLNIPLNALFIYGYGPIEGMGAVGCGVATAIVMWSMLVGGWLYVRYAKKTQIYRSHQWIKPSWALGFKPILLLGLPMAFALLFEVGMFSFIVLFIAPLGTSVIGAHQIAMSFTSLLFMLPLSLAMAMTVRVGLGFGQGERSAVKTSIIVGVGFALIFGILLSLFTFNFRNSIVSLYTSHSEVFHIAAILFIFAASYQVFDAIQVAMAGALRGLHDTQVTMWVTLFSYWGVGLGGGYLLAFANPWGEPLGVYGFWLGIIAGLALAALLLVLRLRWMMKHVEFKQ
ncbi:MATE family efflux transporter [Thiomicrospira microaerophila]|uniref:MATE family efflux transporter n=1 Tax=Thiomicrospira microaerophila TaxID=406020 RepID=UPI00200BA48D|nr:MATE family efflux transporter [Thiomicrospira microaerophila]UQB43386.1 MATE family efflux transporter [Thiomicrospira microaerophila]